MKNKHLISLLFGLFIAPLSILTAQVAINTDGSTPDTKAMLDIKSTDKGVLLPRMTTAQRTAIAPTTTQKGLLVYDTETNSVWQYNGTAWVEIGAAAASLWTAQNATSIYTTNQTVGINTTSPNPNAILDLTSTNKALLPPRMSFDQIKAIPSPSEGMLAYDTDFKCLRMYTGAEWQCQQPTNKEVPDPPGDFSVLATVTGNIVPASTATDVSENVYVTGFFQNTVTFGATTLTSSGSYDVFVVKYNSSGVVQWANKGGGTYDDRGSSIAVDGSGNVSITGFFQSATAIFGSTTLTNGGASNVFVVKYNSSGIVQWATKGGGDDFAFGNAIAVDVNGNVYITGYFTSAIATFGSNNLTNIAAGFSDVFVVKYNTDAVVQWAGNGGGSVSDIGKGVTVDGIGNVYITGFFRSTTATFGPTSSSPYSITLTNTGNADVFIIKYNASGVVQWAIKGGGANNDYGNGIAIDGNSNVYLIGEFSSTTATFSSTNLDNNNTNGTFDVFTAKYNNTGVLQWLFKNGGSDSDYGISIAINPSNTRLYTVGTFSPNAKFGNTILKTGNYFLWMYGE